MLIYFLTECILLARKFPTQISADFGRQTSIEFRLNKQFGIGFMMPGYVNLYRTTIFFERSLGIDVAPSRLICVQILHAMSDGIVRRNVDLAMKLISSRMRS